MGRRDLQTPQKHNASSHNYDLWAGRNSCNDELTPPDTWALQHRCSVNHLVVWAGTCKLRAKSSSVRLPKKCLAGKILYFSPAGWISTVEKQTWGHFCTRAVDFDFFVALRWDKNEHTPDSRNVVKYSSTLCILKQPLFLDRAMTSRFRICSLSTQTSQFFVHFLNFWLSCAFVSHVPWLHRAVYCLFFSS